MDYRVLIVSFMWLMDWTELVCCNRNEFPTLGDIPGYDGEVDGEDVVVRTGQGHLRGRRRQGDPRAGRQ